MKKLALYLVTILGVGGIVFNLFQMIVIISGEYNRNPDIESPILQLLDSIALTGLYLAVSLVVLVASIIMLRRNG